MKQYYIINNGKSIGPLSFDELKQEVITPETLVWYTGMTDWLPANKIQEVTPLMATQLPPPYQGTSPKLPFMAFGAVILVLLFIIGFLVYHSTKPEPLEAEATKKEYALQYAKQYAREHINSLVLVEPLNYTSKPWGGISGLKVAVSNKTSFTIDEVLVEVRYIKSNGGVYTTENIRFNGIKPKHTLTQNASGSNRGVQVETQIVAVRSNELDMN